MAQNQTSDWFPTATGNAQYDENQRRIWQSLYYLRDNGTGTHPVTQNGNNGMSGTAFFPGGFLMGNQTFYSMVFKNGVLVAVA